MAVICLNALIQYQVLVIMPITYTSKLSSKATEDSQQHKCPSYLCIGTSVVTVRAEDTDSGNNGMVTYSIVSGDIGVLDLDRTLFIS